jgi:hypothetical protein
MSAPFVAATLALIQSVRPGLEGSALKAALLAGATHTSALTGSLATGALSASGSLRAVLGETDWQGSLQPLAVRALPTARVSRGAILNWTLDGDSAAVATVRVSVDGRTVADRSAASPDGLRVRARPGLHRWRLVALDASGERLGEAAGLFRVRHADWSTRRARSAKRRG